MRKFIWQFKVLLLLVINYILLLIINGITFKYNTGLTHQTYHSSFYSISMSIYLAKYQNLNIIQSLMTMKITYN